MSRSDNNPLSTQSSGEALAGSQNTEQPVKTVPIDFGINYTKVPDSQPRQENRVKFDFSEWKVGADGNFYQFIPSSVKKKSDQEKAQEGECYRCLIA